MNDDTVEIEVMPFAKGNGLLLLTTYDSWPIKPKRPPIGPHSSTHEIIIASAHGTADKFPWEE